MIYDHPSAASRRESIGVTSLMIVRWRMLRNCNQPGLAKSIGPMPQVESLF